MTWEYAYPPERQVPWSPAWSETYRHLVVSLGDSFGPGWSFEHVGSTSVPGLAAKPVIDIAVRRPDGITLEATDAVFRTAGWSGLVEVGDHTAAVLVHEDVRVAIAHVFTADLWPHAHVRLFARWLRTRAADRERYGELKQRLVEDGVWGSAYTAAKFALVREILDAARAAHGLPPAGTL